MAFVIPDNVKARRDVSASLKRVIGALQVALDETCTVWCEPPYDPSGEKPHLVVLMPDRGLAVLEVLDVKTAGLLGALRGKLRVERDGREVELDSPLIRAERLARVLEERIAAEPRLEGVGLSVAAGAVLPGLGAAELEAKRVSKVLDLSRCLTKDELEAALTGSGEAQVVRAFARMLPRPLPNALRDNVERVVRGLVHPETVIDTVARAPQGTQLAIFRPPRDGDDIVRVLDRQQEAMAKSLGEGHRVIRGVAGSGKTLVLVYRARLLSQLMPRQRILVTCFTRSLASQLRSLLADCSNVEVRHLDSVMADVIRRAHLPHPGFDGDDSGERVAEVALQGLTRGGITKYRAVLLDEAQDFGTNALRFAVGLTEGGEAGDLIVVADAAQNIFRRKFSWKQAGIQAQGRTRLLRVNYRNTKEILEFASRFLEGSSVLYADEVPDWDDENAYIPPQSAARTGPYPEVVLVEQPQEEIQAASELAVRWVDGREPRSTAVLYPSSNFRGGNRAEALYRALRGKGIPVYWLTRPEDTAARDNLATAKDPLVLSTVHSAKGLEFPSVILCGVWREGQDEETNRRLAYVAMTRATERLAVVSTTGHPLEDDLRQAARGDMSIGDGAPRN